MAEHSTIEWTDATWQVVTGCTVISPGCTNCYAMKLAGTRLKHHPSRVGLTTDTKAGPVWNGSVRFNKDWLRQPLEWARPRRIFVCAHGDLFHENVPDSWLDEIFAVMALCPQHTFQVLTKRADRMRAYMQGRARLLARFMIDEYLLNAPDDVKKVGRPKLARWPVVSMGDVDLPDDVEVRPWPLPNVWLGVSVEDQARANERIPELLRTPAAVRWISAEPLLGPIRMPGLYPIGEDGIVDTPTLDWVVAGGESGSDARPMHPDWARSLRDQCIAAGVPFYFKQHGAWREVGHDWDETIEVECDSEMAEHLLTGVKRPAWITPNGEVYRRQEDLPHGVPCRLIEQIGKKAAGRYLDGVIWDELPLGRRAA